MENFYRTSSKARFETKYRRQEGGGYPWGGRGHFKLKLGRHFNAVNNLLMQFHRLIEILVVSLLHINTYGILYLRFQATTGHQIDRLN